MIKSSNKLGFGSTVVSLRSSVLLVAALSLAPSLMADKPIETGEPEVISHRRNPHQTAAPLVGSTTSTTTISYHGGPVMASPNVYIIWYGNWKQSNGSDNPAAQQIVRDFLNSVGGSPYSAINTTYSVNRTAITGNLTFAGETTDSYSMGANLKDADVQAVVKNALGVKKLKIDENGIYLVLTSSDVSESSGFCSRYCGWHTHFGLSGKDLKYSFIGNPAACLTSCAAQSISPNGNAGADAMVSVIAHEVVEVVSDPDINAWYDDGGSENADKCAWTYGTQYLAPIGNGSYANMQLGSRHYLIQRNLIRTMSNGIETDFCAKAYYPSTGKFTQ